MDSNPYLLKETLKYAIKYELYENLIEDLYHTLQLEVKVESVTSKQKLPYICHPNTHRLIKDLVIYESTLVGSDLKFSKSIAGILKKKIEVHLIERSSFIIVAFLETERLKKLISKEDLKSAKKLSKDNPLCKGLQIILKSVK